MLKEGNRTGIVGNPQSLTERVILATQCVSQYKFTIPMVIDGMDGKVNQDYQAAPVRVTVVDIDGKVAFYAGRGPADFRIPPVERTLQKLTANQGRMPPVPAPQWGQPVNGLRCGISIDPPKLALGEEVILRLTFENTTDRPIGLLFDPAQMAGHIVIRNDEGQTLKIQATETGRPSQTRRVPRPGVSIPMEAIRPGQVFECETEGKIVAAADGAAFVAGPFRAVFDLEVSKEMLARVETVRARPLWTGRINSGTCALGIGSPPPADR
jgi:hypothetical protein